MEQGNRRFTDKVWQADVKACLRVHQVERWKDGKLVSTSTELETEEEADEEDADWDEDEPGAVRAHACSQTRRQSCCNLILLMTRTPIGTRTSGTCLYL